MEYLRIKKAQKMVRADGTPYASALFVKKNRKYGDVISEQTISKKKSCLVTGAHDSGKTRWLSRLNESSSEIYGGKHKSEPLWLGALRPIGAWCDSPQVVEWWEKRRKAANDDEYRPWANLKQWERAEILPDYLTDTNAVLFIDDAHKLSGRKLQIARMCALSCRLSVVSASEEQRIPPNLRNVLMRRDPQIFRLNSDVAYDATSIIMWLLIVSALMVGAWELSLMLGGLKALGTGRRASRAD